MCVCFVVVVVVVESLNVPFGRGTTGRFLATIGYVVQTPNHVHIHHVQQSENECPYSSVWDVCVCVLLLLLLLNSLNVP